MNKLAKLLLSAALLLVMLPSAALAQQKTVSLRGNAMTLTQAFSTIEKNSGYSFFWNEELNPLLSGRINVDIQNQTIEQVLTYILNGKGLTYKINGAQVIITKAAANVQPSKKQKLSGTVISASDNQPLIGVTVYVKGTNNMTTTDLDGNYELTISPSDKEVTFSCLGFEEKSLPVSQEILFKVVTMIESTNSLDEVVVVGFGTQKKESLVGSITTIKPTNLKVTSSNLSTSFVGKVAGIISVQSSGEPGADGANFWIRGISTFGSNKTPLIILDGVEVDQTILNSIAPETIEQFSVLKDATSTALYGSRGANGVLIVTTKSGHNSEKMSINVRVENGFTTPTRITEIADGVTYMENFNEARLTRGMLPQFTQQKIDGTRDKLDQYIYPNNDWYSMLFKDFSLSQNVNANFRGGSSKIDYFLNASFYNEDGMLRNTGMSNYNTNEVMQKYVFQSNISAKITPTTKLALKMTTQLMNRKGTSAVSNTLFQYTMTANPVDFAAVYPAEEGDSVVRYGNAPNWDGGAVQTNPLASLNQGYCNKFWGNVLATLTLDQDLSFLTEGLSVSGLASFKNYSYSNTWNTLTPYYYQLSDYYTDIDGNMRYTTVPIGPNGTNYLTPGVSNSGNRIFSFQVTADYKRTFGKHDVSSTLVYHQKEQINSVPSASQNQILPYCQQGIAGRLTYGYDSRYLIEGNFGYNGSENFYKNKRWGFFPSVAAGWCISNEPFYGASLKEVVSLLKLRASYGLVGNDTLPVRFPYLTAITMDSTDNEFGAYYGKDSFVRYKGVQVTTWGNEDATWEVSRKLNLGLEIGLFNDLTLITDFFTEDRTGIFMLRRSIPATSGFQESTPYGNIGAVSNRGVDMSLEYNKVVNKDFTISAQGTFTYAHNEVTAKDEPDYEYAYQALVGKPINSIYGYVSSGLFASDEEVKNSPAQSFGSVLQAGDIKYVDLNGDGLIDGNDQTCLGYPTIPEITYGFGVSMQYKGFDASLFFQGVSNVSILMSNHHPFLTNVYSGYNMTKWVADDHWSEENQNLNAAYPRLSPTWNMNNTQTSSFWIKDGSYLRLKNVEFGYTWKSVRFYAAASNLFTISRFKYWDPELGNGNGLSYPLQRIMKLGIQYNF